MVNYNQYISLQNFNNLDFVADSHGGRVGYKIYESLGLNEAPALLLCSYLTDETV